ncbi:putative quinol monooxygenase [Desulfomicrobium baculatum]|uniref:Antibiotic biosynthesis monooxygenase n=1 Tax=Desulfomicrobium baculatum (strain DSM 4028 / VKM B-1378 / X) TaxID=525897 RepID=C7LTA7_DESBD|nr:putative quinol monooxygenase [Desulfomicrobium baculatum]ACU88331.1 Antibiotic biosynthesis monooxygenase [Desulfomicrobium baculatum DSM 4028]
MFVVIVDIVIKKEFVENFREAVLRQGENSMSREEGCLGFDILENPEDPSRITLYESYTDAATFYGIHRETPHFTEYARTTAPWVESKSMRALTKIWPKN